METLQDQPEVITLSDSDDETETISKTITEWNRNRIRKGNNAYGLTGPRYPEMYAVEKECMIPRYKNVPPPQLSSDIDKIIENTLKDSGKRVLEENLLPETKKRKLERNVYPTRNTTRYQAKRSTLGNFWKPKLVTKDRLDFYKNSAFKKKKYLDEDLYRTYTNSRNCRNSQT